MGSRRAVNTQEKNILDRIRRRPQLFLGKRSLSALHNFLAGYSVAHYELGVKQPDQLPADFHDWVAYRLHFRGTSSGYANMILGRTPNEAEAFDRFFQLLDEHFMRKGRVVAKIRHHLQSDKLDRVNVPPRSELSESAEEASTEEASIIVYTDDPGFYFMSGEGSHDCPKAGAFCPSLSMLFKPFQPDPDFTTVVDQDQFNRLLGERVEFERATREESEARQRSLAKQPGKIN